MKRLINSLFAGLLLFVAPSAMQAGSFDDEFSDWVFVEKKVPTESESNNFWRQVDGFLSSNYPSLKPTAQKIRSGVDFATSIINMGQAAQFHMRQLGGFVSEMQRIQQQFPQGAALASKSSPEKMQLYANYMRTNVSLFNKSLEAIKGLIDPLKVVNKDTYNSSMKFIDQLKALALFFSMIAEKMENLADSLRYAR